MVLGDAPPIGVSTTRPDTATGITTLAAGNKESDTPRFVPGNASTPCEKIACRDTTKDIAALTAGNIKGSGPRIILGIDGSSPV